MASPKSPFMVFPDFLSPKQCETIVDRLGFYSPDIDQQGNPMKMYRMNEPSEVDIFERLQEVLPSIMEYYDIGYQGTEQMIFEFLATGTITDHICENSNYIRKKWVRTKNRDLTCVLFLSDYNEHPPFDSEYEVYGGKLEFPQYGFSFNPTRGTMIVYPSGPHFINANAAVIAGDLYQARIHIAADLPFMYQPEDFPGDFRKWFAGM